MTELCRKAGISQAIYFAWRKKFAGLLPTKMRRLKQLEDENTRLRKLVADLSLDKEMLRGTSSAESSCANVSWPMYRRLLRGKGDLFGSGRLVGRGHVCGV